MSTRIPHGLNDLHTQLVLRGDEQDSTHVAEKIAAWHAKFLLGEVPRKTRERRGKGERIDGVPRVLSYLPALHTVRREVVRIAPAPRGLRPHAPRRLANRRGTRALTNPHTPVGSEPATTDTARALPEHPPMLYASQGFRGPLLASRPLSFLESGEEVQELTESIAVGTDGVGTRLALLHQAVGEEPLLQHGKASSLGHGHGRSSQRPSSRRMAWRISSGEPLRYHCVSATCTWPR